MVTISKDQFVLTFLEEAPAGTPVADRVCTHTFRKFSVFKENNGAHTALRLMKNCGTYLLPGDYLRFIQFTDGHNPISAELEAYLKTKSVAYERYEGQFLSDTFTIFVVEAKDMDDTFEKCPGARWH